VGNTLAAVFLQQTTHLQHSCINWRIESVPMPVLRGADLIELNGKGNIMLWILFAVPVVMLGAVAIAKIFEVKWGRFWADANWIISPR
jgi:hypothetical protein